MPPGFLSSQRWGFLLPGADSPWGTGKCSWEVKTEDLPWAPVLCLLSESDDSFRSLVPGNAFLWDLNSDGVLKAACNTVG